MWLSSGTAMLVPWLFTCAGRSRYDSAAGNGEIGSFCRRVDAWPWGFRGPTLLSRERTALSYLQK
jgi:hypothetical protein